MLTLAGVSGVSALVGLLLGGGPGLHNVTTSRGAEVTLYGHGLYAADSQLIGTGARGQDLVLLLVEIPALLLVLRWWRRGTPLGAAALAGVLAFFAYFETSLVLANAQNRLFPLYVVGAATAGLALVLVSRRLDPTRVAIAMPRRPGDRVLAWYLGFVALALTAAWLPGLLATAISGDIAAHVGPYTSSVTEALDLGVIVPVAVVAAVQVRRGTALGRTLALVLLVVNVSIGMLLVGQGAFQLAVGVPLTVADIVARMATFTALTVVAGLLLVRMAREVRRTT